MTIAQSPQSPAKSVGHDEATAAWQIWAQFQTLATRDPQAWQNWLRLAWTIQMSRRMESVPNGLPPRQRWAGETDQEFAASMCKTYHPFDMAEMPYLPQEDRNLGIPGCSFDPNGGVADGRGSPAASCFEPFQYGDLRGTLGHCGSSYLRDLHAAQKFVDEYCPKHPFDLTQTNFRPPFYSQWYDTKPVGLPQPPKVSDYKPNCKAMTDMERFQTTGELPEKFTFTNIPPVDRLKWKDDPWGLPPPLDSPACNPACKVMPLDEWLRIDGDKPEQLTSTFADWEGPDGWFDETYAETEDHWARSEDNGNDQEPNWGGYRDDEAARGPDQSCFQSEQAAASDPNQHNYQDEADDSDCDSVLSDVCVRDFVKRALWLQKRPKPSKARSEKVATEPSQNDHQDEPDDCDCESEISEAFEELYCENGTEDKECPESSESPNGQAATEPNQQSHQDEFDDSDCESMSSELFEELYCEGGAVYEGRYMSGSSLVREYVYSESDGVAGSLAKVKLESPTSW